MIVIRRSPLTGQINEREIDVTQEQLDRYAGGFELIQEIMPDVSKEDREFIKTGYTPEDWKHLFGDSNAV